MNQNRIAFDVGETRHQELRDRMEKQFQALIDLEHAQCLTPHWHRVGDIIQFSFEDPVGVDVNAFNAVVEELTPEGHLKQIREIDTRGHITDRIHQVKDFVVKRTTIRSVRWIAQNCPKIPREAVPREDHQR